MKDRRLVVALAAFAAGCGATVVVYGHHGGTRKVDGSGVPATVVRELPPFDKIELSGFGTVDVHPGSPQKVTVSGDDNVVPLVTTEVHGDTLVVGSKNASISTKLPLVVGIRVPSVTASSLTGSGELNVDGVAGPAFDASLSGTGTLDVGGRVDELSAEVSGVGSAALEHLVAKNVRVVVSGVGSAHVYATHSLDASVPGTGSVLYRGDPPQVTTHVTGLGSVAAA
jgi:hypothetical protein